MATCDESDLTAPATTSEIPEEILFVNTHGRAHDQQHFIACDADDEMRLMTTPAILSFIDELIISLFAP